jgi:hypothetical protein
MHYLTLVAIAKDETRNLREWLVYHALLGVESCIIYDNESRVPIRETLAPFFRDDFLKVVEIPGQNMQLQAYNHALSTFGDSTRWMGFIDLDEYIVPQTTNDLRHFLTDYEAHAALVANWVMYGSSGHEKRPHGLMIENYTRRLPLEDPQNFHIKSIVKPASTLRALSPHHFEYRPGCGAVNPDHMPISSPFSPLCADKLRINHYYFRSREEFEEKIKRGRADTNAPGLRRGIEAFEAQFQARHDEDLSAIKYLEELKISLKKDSADEVIASARRSIAQDQPGYLSIYVDLARLGATDKAEGVLREALARFPDDPVLIAVRAGTLRLLGDTTRALAEAHRSLALTPTAQALTELAAVHTALGEHALAQRVREFQNYLITFGHIRG